MTDLPPAIAGSHPPAGAGSHTQTPPVHCQNPRRLVWIPSLRPSPKVEGLGCRELSFEAHLCVSCVHCDPAVAGFDSMPALRRAQGLELVETAPHPASRRRSWSATAGLNRLIAPAGLSPALTPASRAHQHLTFTKSAWCVRAEKQQASRRCGTPTRSFNSYRQWEALAMPPPSPATAECWFRRRERGEPMQRPLNRRGSATP
jgi:hypothetical protein